MTQESRESRLRALALADEALSLALPWMQCTVHGNHEMERRLQGAKAQVRAALSEIRSCAGSESGDIFEAWVHAYTSLGCDRANAERIVRNEIATFNAAPQAQGDLTTERPATNPREQPAALLPALSDKSDAVQRLLRDPLNSNDLMAWRTLAFALQEQLQSARSAELDSIPEGCTPADARVLREANHRLAEENHRLERERDAALQACCPGNNGEPDPVRCQSYEASEQAEPCPPGCCAMADEKDVRAILAAIEQDEESTPSHVLRSDVVKMAQDWLDGNCPGKNGKPTATPDFIYFTPGEIDALCAAVVRCAGSATGTTETNEQFAERAAKNIMNSADAQCFRWLLKHHAGAGKALAGQGMRCWIGGVEFHGEDIRNAILTAIDREELSNFNKLVNEVQRDSSESRNSQGGEHG